MPLSPLAVTRELYPDDTAYEAALARREADLADKDARPAAWGASYATCCGVPVTIPAGKTLTEARAAIEAGDLQFFGRDDLMLRNIQAQMQVLQRTAGMQEEATAKKK
jgi:hypothetical protein